MHFMNRQRARHMGSETHEHEGGEKPQIFVHSHSKGHTVHVFHHDGTHESHEHSKGDAEGITDHVHNELGGEQRPENDGEMGADSNAGLSD